MTMRTKIQKLMYPAPYLRKDTFASAQRYHTLARLLNPFEVALRNRGLNMLREAEPLFFMPHEVGFARVDVRGHPDAEPALAAAREIAQRIRASEPGHAEGESKKPNKSYLREIDVDPAHPASDPISRLALSPEMLAAAARYLATIPVLDRIRVWYSPNDAHLGGSQNFHIDHADINQVKIFVNLTDVSSNSGPLKALPASKSRYVYDALAKNGKITARKDKVPDELFFRYAHASDVQTFTGQVGEGAAVDTCAVYHHGSRPAPSCNSTPRETLMIQFTTPFSAFQPLVGRRRRRIAHPWARDAQHLKVLQLVLGYRHLARLPR